MSVPAASPRDLSGVEKQIISTLIRGVPESALLMEQVTRAHVTERGGDGWVLEFHIDGYSRPKRTSLKVSAEGVFQAIDGTIKAAILLFLDENNKIRELEISGYSVDSEKPYPPLEQLRVLEPYTGDKGPVK